MAEWSAEELGMLRETCVYVTSLGRLGRALDQHTGSQAADDRSEEDRAR
jgi:hypothetical protein